MPRSKTGIKRKKICKDDIEKAITFIKEQKMTIGEASRHFGLKKPTLIYHLNALKRSGNADFSYNPKKTKKVFSDAEEILLVDYLTQAANMHYGLTKKQVMTLAYGFAKANNKKIDPSWEANKCAGKQWLRDFRKKFYDKLSLRKPEATSLARATAFNKETVAQVFNNYKSILQRHSLEPSDIWNCDETGISTVHVPPKVIASKGKKQIGAMTSAERGTTVTMITAVSASGNSVPPLFVFPRVNFKPFMLHGAPPGSIGAANPSGWSNEVIFQQFFEHFLKHVRPSIEKPVLLLIDNHESHITIPLIDLAKTAGVILMTFHPHTSHKFQPLDRGVYGPFKTFYNQAVNNWMLTPGNVGKPLTIYNIAELAGTAYSKAVVPNNIIKGFKVSGFVPFNENVFSDDEFVSATVTDRPIPQETQTCEFVSDIDEPSTSLATQTVNMNPQCSKSDRSPVIVTPEAVRPHPKAQARKMSNRGRRKGKSRILTDTPERLAIEAVKEKHLKRKTPCTNKHLPKIAHKKCLFHEDSSESDDNIEISSEESDIDLSDECRELDDQQQFEKDDLEKGNFILVKISSKKTVKYFVAEICEISNYPVFQIQYLKKQTLSNKFTREDEKLYDIDIEDIVAKLPNPVTTSGSARQLECLSFGVDFSSYKVE